MGRDPRAEVEISAHSRGLNARLREARAKFSSFGSDLKKHVFGKDVASAGGFMSKAGATMVGNLGSNAVGAAASFFADQGRDVYAFNDALKRLEITASKTPEEMDAFAKSVRKTSTEVGIGAGDILAGAQAYVALTGDMDGAAASSRTWARVAQATNSTVGDIASTAAALKQQMDIKPDQMEATFSALAVQGKAGAIELKDLALQMSSIAPQWAQFEGGKGVQGVKELGAALQIVKRGFGGDAGETITGLQSFLTSVVQHSRQLKKGSGFDVFTKNAVTGKRELKGVLDIVNGIADSKLANNPTKLVKALGRVEAYRAFIQLRDNRKELEKLVEVSGDAGAIQRDLDTYNRSSAGRVKLAWQAAKNEIAEAFTPERIESFASAVAKLATSVASIATAFSTVLAGAEHVGQGLAMLFGGDSEEDRISKLRAGRLDERADILRKQILRDNPKLDSANPEDWQTVEQLVSARMGQEDSQEDLLRAGKRAGVGQRDAVFVNVPAFDKKGELAGFKKHEVMPRRGYGEGFDLAELVALRDKADKGDATNKANVVSILDQKIAELLTTQAKLNSMLSLIPGMKVVVGADPIATATRQAPQNARRPGG